MFEKKVWNDRQSEHPARRRLTPTENDNEYEVSRAEGLVMEEGDAFDATTMNDLENRVAKAFAEYDPAELGAVNVTVQLYTCKKEGKVYQLTGSGAVGRCKIPAAWASGDTWTVNGTTVPAYCGADAVDGDTIVAGRWAIFTFDGQQLNFNGGGGLSSGKLARATAKASQVLDGVPFYAGSKTLQKGTMRNNGSWPDADKLTLENGKLYMYKANGYTEGGLEAVASLLGDASASDIMQGTAASSSKGLHVAGSIVDRGNWSAQIVPGGKVTIPPGRHAGDGSVSAAALKTMALRVSDWPHEYPGMEWHYTLTGGTLVGVAGLGRASGDASSNVIESIRIAGNTIYVVRRTYTIIRGRNFVKLRRAILRAQRDLDALGYVPWWRAQRIMSQWGEIKHSDSRGFCQKYNVYKIIRAAKRSVSWHSKQLLLKEQTHGAVC